MKKKTKKLSMQQRREIVLNCINNSEESVRTSQLLEHLPGMSRPLLATDLNWLIVNGKITRVSHGTDLPPRTVPVVMLQFLSGYQYPCLPAVA